MKQFLLLFLILYFNPMSIYSVTSDGQCYLAKPYDLPK